MARKSQKSDRASDNRMQAIDDPTAAFPIGMLSQLVDHANSASLSEEDRPRVADGAEALDDEDEDSESDSPSPHVSPGTIQLGYVLLSLLGGGIAAAMFAALIVVVALLL